MPQVGVGRLERDGGRVVNAGGDAASGQIKGLLHDLLDRAVVGQVRQSDDMLGSRKAPSTEVTT